MPAVDVLAYVKWSEGGNSKGSIEIVVGDLTIRDITAESIGRTSSEVAPTPEAKTCAGSGVTVEGEGDLPLGGSVSVPQWNSRRNDQKAGGDDYRC
jgi:hypothetical protein